VDHEYEHKRTGSQAFAPNQNDTLAPGKSSRSALLRRPEHPVASGLVQRKAHDASDSGAEKSADRDGAGIHELADRGMAGPPGALPHRETIQKSFGPGHDLSGVGGHVGGPATAAATEMGALAYAKGDQVAFAEQPSLHTAAHEAAHVVQQRAGVQLKSGVGEAGDAYERHADAVADVVVAGGSAESLLSTLDSGASSGSGGAVQHAVQLLGTALDHKPPKSEPAPEFGEDKGIERRFSLEQYIAMWEKEQGRKMTAVEKTTLERGCVGVTAANLHGGGNPLNCAEKKFATFELAHKYMVDHNKLLDDAAKKHSAAIAPARYALFANLFFSNQSPEYDKRFKPDDKAFLPDPKTGEIDMSGYYYEPQSRIKKDKQTGADIKLNYMNFDYGFWDEASKCFWHANHNQRKDPDDPMIVIQTTRERFVKGYIDFDRIVFCVALADNYNPALAALVHARSR